MFTLFFVIIETIFLIIIQFTSFQFRRDNNYDRIGKCFSVGLEIDIEYQSNRHQVE